MLTFVSVKIKMHTIVSSPGSKEINISSCVVKCRHKAFYHFFFFYLSIISELTKEVWSILKLKRHH